MLHSAAVFRTFLHHWVAMNDSQRLSEAPPSEVLQALIGTVVAERYEVEALLGSGGMGAVYKAKHLHMRKTVALKVLHRSMASVPEVVSRFEREAVAAARVDHPNIATATDFGRLADGSFYLIMEYVDGTNLRAVLENGPLPLSRVFKIGHQVAAALAAAHALGIVHRDLKPDNVMLVDRPNDPDFVKVLDLGIAKLPAENSATGPALTRVGTVLGTPQYMAPEQAAGNPVDHRADLYALGVILYEMISGQPPFSGADVMSLLVKQLTEAAPKLPDSTPPNWSKLVMQLLEKEPGERPQSASEVLTRFEELELAPIENPAPAVTVETAPAIPVTIAKLRTPRNALIAGGVAAGVLTLFALGASNTETKKESAPTEIASALPRGARPANALTKDVHSPSNVTASDRSAAAPVVTPSVDRKPATESKAVETNGSSAKADAGARKTSDTAAQSSTTKSAKRKPAKRRTGPGGIYIPPPDQWFK